MSDLVPYTTPAPTTFTADWLRDPAEIAQRIGGTDFVPQGLRNNPAAITAALLYGAEVGLKPVTSLRSIAVINGRVAMGSEAMRALILQAGHDIWIDELTLSRCTIAGRRKDSDQISRVTWTLDDARRAGLAGRQAWRQYPRQMLLARASAELARAVFPDAIAGLAASEELEDGTDTAATEKEAEPDQKTTRRRRRANVTSSPAVAPESEPPAAPASDDPPKPPPAATDQELIDEIKREFDATETTPEPAPISENQRRKIMALFRERGIEDRKQRLAYSSNIVNRELTTSTDLTSDEASRIIDQLEQDKQEDNYPWTDFNPA
jgi:hypothetical protein